MPEVTVEAEAEGALVDNDARAALLRERLGLLSEIDVAVMFGCSERTLSNWRVDEAGPDYVRVGRNVFYRLMDVQQWIAMNLSVMTRTKKARR